VVCAWEGVPSIEVRGDRADETDGLLTGMQPEGHKSMAEALMSRNLRFLAGDAAVCWDAAGCGEGGPKAPRALESDNGMDRLLKKDTEVRHEHGTGSVRVWRAAAGQCCGSDGAVLGLDFTPHALPTSGQRDGPFPGVSFGAAVAHVTCRGFPRGNSDMSKSLAWTLWTALEA
jgi:hypothetical protein